MNDPLPPLPPKSSALNDYFKANQVWIDRTIFLIVIAVVASIFHVKLADILQNVNSAKDIVTDTNKTQKAVVNVEVRGTPQDVAALKATTQEAK